MEAYGFFYEEGAAPSLPPGASVSMPIWGTALPAHTTGAQPRFLATAPSAPLSDPLPLLEEAGCGVEPGGQATCPPDGPLAAFGCESIHLPIGLYPAFGLDALLVGTCYLVPPAGDQSRDEYLFRRGCAFRRNAAYIFQTEGQYVLISTPSALNALFAPIETPEEALTYAQLATGLVAQFAFEYDPDLLYFRDVIEGTTVTDTGPAYIVTLFHFMTCLCEPWVNSQVEIRVDRSGEVTWLGGAPISMTTGFACAD